MANKPLLQDSGVFSVIVKPGSSKEGFEVQEDGSIVLKIRQKPVDNAANEAVIEKMAEILKKPKSAISIKSGLKSRKKIILAK